ncbi:MAG: alpha/beta fold hydrolase [Eubacteriales bacterium]|nr:alpha/beta fold hydrolase [Eubacteriales bacterium]
MSKKTEYTFKSQSDGLNISVLQIEPEGAPKAILQMAHGMAEHKERYIPLMEYLASRGYVCVMNDHRGHGRSIAFADDLGYFGRSGAKSMVDDVHQLTLRLRKKWPGLPLFLYGHSMGSLVVRVYRSIYEKDIDGLIVCGSPGRNEKAKALEKILRFVMTFHGAHSRSGLVERLTAVSNKRFASEGSPFAWLNSDPAEVKKYEDDPMCGYRFTINGYHALVKLLVGAYMPMRTNKPDMPIHFIAGADDPCLPDEAGFRDAIEMMKKNGCRRVTQILYPGMRHEIHLEREKEKVWKDLGDVMDGWLV